MRRFILVGVGCAVLGGILWAMVGSLQPGSVRRDEPPAVILRAPEGFDVIDLGPASLAVAARALAGQSGNRVGVEYAEDGDRVILLANREHDEITELRASRTGTVVQRAWPGEAARRLEHAVENGSLDVPGLEPATGKNLYH